MAEIRESVRNIVDEIPWVLSGAKQYIEVFAESLELHKCNAGLYVAIIRVLDAILQQCQQHVARKSAYPAHLICTVPCVSLILPKGRLSSALFRQNMSGKELLDKIGNIKIYADRLATQASISSMKRQKIMLEGEKDMTKMIISSVRSQDRGFNTMALSHNDILRTLDSQNRALQSLDRNLHLIAQIQLCNVQVLNQCMHLLKASPKPAVELVSTAEYLSPEIATEGRVNALSRSRSPSAELEQQQCRQELNELLIALNADQQLDVAATDTSNQLNLMHTLSLASQDRFVALITSSRLQNWLTSPFSSILHVNGHMFLNEHEARQSPLSCFCAKFIDDMQSHRQYPHQETSSFVIAICWFCGQHTNVGTDYDAHPPGMLNSLLLQLIDQISRSTFQMRLVDCCVPEPDPQLSELCNLFVLLAEALPMGTILFCVIDGISYYEDEERQAECIEVLSMLTTLTRRSQGAADGPLIKLLITAPLRAHYEHELLEEEEVLNMDEHYPSKGGFSALQWNVGIGDVIKQ